MEKSTTWRRLSTYSVNRQTLQSLADTISQKIPPLLQVGGPAIFADHISLIVYGSDSSEVYRPLNKYTQLLFNNDTDRVMIELSYKEEGDSQSARAIVVELRLGHSRMDSYLSIALQDFNRAKEKVLAIEELLLTTLAPYQNRNWITYPNDFIPTLVFVAGFVIGLISFMFTNPFLKFLCLLFFGVAIYFVARHFTRGYCAFESRHQKRLDVLLNFLTGAVVIFLVVVLLTGVV
ncbi:MAG: hypothetical protein ABUM51_08565 [Bacteroidota bacterium]